MRDEGKPYCGVRHERAALSAKKLAESADNEKLIQMLRMYADDLEGEDGRAHAPQWMREAARRIKTLTKST